MSETHEGVATTGDNSSGILKELKRYVARAAAVMNEQKEVAEALKEICTEADEAGVATKREIRQLARESLMDHGVLNAQLDRMDVLRRALGGFADTPLGQATVKAEAKPVKRGPGRPRKANGATAIAEAKEAMETF